MMMRMRVASWVVAFSLAVVAPILAQMESMPVYFSPKGGVGLTLDGDFGRISTLTLGTIDATVHPTAIGGRAYLGLPIVTVGVGASVYDPKSTAVGTASQFMGSVAIQLFKQPLVPIAVSGQIGAGYLKVGTGTTAVSQVTVPIGIGVALNVPTPGASVEPWLAGRLNVRSVSVGTSSASRVGPGVSGGVNLGLFGLGLHVAVDWSSYPDKPTSAIPAEALSLKELTVGVGLHYQIKLPGIPGVPII